ncbi:MULTISPECIES: hypothetical protein [unclassified Frankia]
MQPNLASALLGAFAAPLTGLLGEGTGARGYVTGVTHTLSCSAGFLTELTWSAWPPARTAGTGVLPRPRPAR